MTPGDVSLQEYLNYPARDEWDMLWFDQLRCDIVTLRKAYIALPNYIRMADDTYQAYLHYREAYTWADLPREPKSIFGIPVVIRDNLPYGTYRIAGQELLCEM